MPPNALMLLAALRRRYKLALGVGLILGALVAVAAWFLIPRSKYTTRALLLVASSQPKMIFKTAETAVDFQTYQRTQLALIKSRNVLEKALRDPKVSKLDFVRELVDPFLWLEKQVQADYVGEVLRISMSGDKPEDLATLVDAVTKAYYTEVVDVENKERIKRKDDLTRIYNDYQVRLRVKREELKKLADGIGSKQKQTIRYTHELAIERASTSRRELFQIQSDLRRAKAELEIRKAQVPNGAVAAAAPEAAIQAAVQRYVDEDPEVKRYAGKIAELKTAIARLQRSVRDLADPALQARFNELEASRKALAARVAVLRPQAFERLRHGDPEGEDMGVKGLRVRIGVLEELARATQVIVDAQSAEAQGINQNSNYIDDIQDEIAHADSAARRIGEELETLSVELTAPPRVRQLESAGIPRKEDDKRVVMAGMAGFGTFGLFALGVAFLEFRTQRISSIDEVTLRLGLRVVGAMPPIRDSGRRGARGGRGPVDVSVLTESIDSIRTMLLHSTGDRSLRTIMITSALGGEGKTSLACHLATSLARSGLKTLLIDCDLRKPTIHHLFDIPPTPGFSEFLRREVGANEVIRTTTVDGPDVIAAGTCDSLALRALAQADSGAIFDVFRSSHDIIVVDTSPILPVTDALLVGRHVDASVYSILRDVSRLPCTLSAIGRLKAMNIRVIGAVVTGVRSQGYGSSYNYYPSGIHHG